MSHRNLELYLAIKAYALGVIKLVLNRSEEQFFNLPEKQVGQPYTFVSSTDLSFLPEYQKCVEIISNDPVISNHIDRFVGTSEIGLCQISLSNLLEKFIKSGDFSRTWSFNNENFERTYTQLENDIYSDFILCEAVAPLEGIFANNIQTINLADNLEISQLNQKEEQLFHTTSLIRRNNFRWSDNLYAVRSKYHLPKVKVNDLSDISSVQKLEEEKLQSEIEERVKQVVHIMRAFKQGSLHYGGIIHWNCSNLFSGSMKISPKSLELVNGIYLLESNEEIYNFKNFYRKIKTITVNSQNTAIEKAIRIYGSREINWGDLYKVYEIVESNVGGIKKILNEGWSSETNIKNFKHTANSASAAGDDARHGKETTCVPTNPVSLPEAGSLIQTILKRWIDFKSKQHAVQQSR